ncbi:hypothetical protein NE235_01815 [Actinoallomurus spadix]|uniref:hypothetical protein n=1 Tax=Actinoallomurus spadix TaxID=79912 RepID=UPI0020921159|nr:hypothetical protein [Actinoallomurus spadix]MCO5984838.1 hypothetical protein [Actinoallomurus spadix]
MIGLRGRPGCCWTRAGRTAMVGGSTVRVVVMPGSCPSPGARGNRFSGGRAWPYARFPLR